MPTWNATYPIFNDSTVVESVSARRYVNRRVVARAAEARRQVSKNRYWTDDLSGLTLTGPQLEEIRALEACARGGIFPVLKRISSFCTFENEDGSPSPLGTGDGTTRTFQLRKTTNFQGRIIIDEIHFPWFDYPDLRDLNGDTWEPLIPLGIWIGDYRDGGTNITSDCDIDRDTGLVTSDATGSLSSTGGFLVKMLAPNGIGVTTKGGGTYDINSGVQLIEPFPGVDELFS